MHKLRLKYGLATSEPTASQAQQWKRRVQQLRNAGVEAEAAGHQAAKEIFRTYQTHGYATQSDTIYDLLEELDND